MSTLDIQSASELMHIHPKTVLALINSGALPAGKVGRAYVLLTKDVMAYVENLIIRQTAERMGLTRGASIGRSRAGSRNGAAPASSYGR